jgi:hypothetical protein
MNEKKEKEEWDEKREKSKVLTIELNPPFFKNSS